MRTAILLAAMFAGSTLSAIASPATHEVPATAKPERLKYYTKPTARGYTMYFVHPKAKAYVPRGKVYKVKPAMR